MTCIEVTITQCEVRTPHEAIIQTERGSLLVTRCYDTGIGLHLDGEPLGWFRPGIDGVKACGFSIKGIENLRPL